ncbi:MAG TPA: M56 family metallopeptidase [Candidatus Acidoferrales bacterium]|nr:M56 family metallopeptidase [Candidatus Acidoferrales bacterium]
MSELGNHLWQSTLFAAAVAAACFALKNNRARTRYWLWLAASLKFLVPFSLLLSLGTRVEIRSVRMATVMPAMRVEQITTSFAPMPVAPVAAASPLWRPLALAAIWIAGSLLLAGRWLWRWSALRRLRRNATPLPMHYPIPVAVLASAIEPGVFGLFRPVLLLPEGLAAKLTPEQMETVLAHELCHVRSRDNLTAALHLLAGTLFWFHPAMWWIGRRLIEERERACDEAVLGQGSQPETYAQSILNICTFYAESPLACAPGVTGADLKQRIREIMAQRVTLRLTLARKVALAAAALAAVCTPLVIGMLRAQTLPPPPQYTYEVVSIKPSDPGSTDSRIGPGPQGGIRTQGTTAMTLLTVAYDLRSYQIVAAPGWVQSERYDVSFTPDKPEVAFNPSMTRQQAEATFNRQRQRLQAVLRDRFNLLLRAETRELPMYALVVAKNGPRLTPAADPKAMRMMTGRGQITATATDLTMFAHNLAALLGRYVANETGLTAPYDLKLEWTPDAPVQSPQPGEPAAATEAGTSIFTALTEQLGLRLESKKGPVPVYVIERIEKPSAN